MRRSTFKRVVIVGAAVALLVLFLPLYSSPPVAPSPTKIHGVQVQGLPPVAGIPKASADAKGAIPNAGLPLVAVDPEGSKAVPVHSKVGGFDEVAKEADSIKSNSLPNKFNLAKENENFDRNADIMSKENDTNDQDTGDAVYNNDDEESENDDSYESTENKTGNNKDYENGEDDYDDVEPTTAYGDEDTTGSPDNDDGGAKDDYDYDEENQDEDGNKTESGVEREGEIEDEEGENDETGNANTDTDDVDEDDNVSDDENEDDNMGTGDKKSIEDDDFEDETDGEEAEKRGNLDEEEKAENVEADNGADEEENDSANEADEEDYDEDNSAADEDNDKYLEDNGNGNGVDEEENDEDNDEDVEGNDEDQGDDKGNNGVLHRNNEEDTKVDNKESEESNEAVEEDEEDNGGIGNTDPGVNDNGTGKQNKKGSPKVRNQVSVRETMKLREKTENINAKTTPSTLKSGLTLGESGGKKMIHGGVIKKHRVERSAEGNNLSKLTFQSNDKPSKESSQRIVKAQAPDNVNIMNKQTKTKIATKPKVLTNSVVRTKQIAPPAAPTVPANAVKRTLPDIVILGAWKAGTGALNLFLTKHPNIAGNDWEVNYFTANHKQGRRWYFNRLKQPKPGQKVLEDSASYFFYPEKVCKYMQKFKFSPKTKFLFVVREPVSRAISHYAMGLRFKRLKGRMGQNILKIEDGKKVLDETKAIVKAGYYYLHLTRWYKCFPRKSFLVVDGAALRTDPITEIKRVEKFLGLPDKTAEMGFHKSKETGEYCVLNADGAPHCTFGRGQKSYPKVSPFVRTLLMDYYKDKNKMFFKLVGRKFDWKPDVS